MYSRQVFFFNDTATTEIYTLSLHDALPIYPRGGPKDYPRLFPAPRTRPIFRPAETQIPAELSGRIRYRIFSFPRSNKAPASTDDRNRALRPSRLFFRPEKARKDRWRTDDSFRKPTFEINPFQITVIAAIHVVDPSSTAKRLSVSGLSSPRSAATLRRCWCSWTVRATTCTYW